jgi:hypothetical protein
MKFYAPVLISVLDRYEHFKNCVVSLAQNPLADKTILYIALDAPFAEKHREGHSKVLSYVEEIYGFKEVILFRRETNMGSTPNQFLAMDDIFQQYDRLIFTEDDNVFSPNFLYFVNRGLEIYKNRGDIFSVSGYNYNITCSGKSNMIYLWPGFSAWGVGIWKDKWKSIDFSLQYIENAIYRKDVIRRTILTTDHYLPALLKILKTKEITDDTLVCLHIIENKMKSVFPIISKVRNQGADGSGEHCGINDNLIKQEIDKSIDDISEFIVQDAKTFNIENKLKQLFKRTMKENVLNYVYYLKYYLNR